MEKFSTALEMVTALKPDIPILAARPHAAGRAARWFIENFPGEVAYAYKANSSLWQRHYPI
jgi:ornithine decarboxylase